MPRLSKDEFTALMAQRGFRTTVEGYEKGRCGSSPTRAIQTPAMGLPAGGREAKTLKLSTPRMSESQMQQQIIKWWAVACREFQVPERLLMSFPLQGARTPRNGARLKAEGLRAGTPDMLLAVCWFGGRGLWLELKTPKGRLTASQREMLSNLDTQGYQTCVPRSVKEAIDQITAYMKPIDTSPME